MIFPLRRNFGWVFILHSVLPEKERSLFPQNRSLEITPEDLRVILRWTEEKGLEPVALDDLPQRLGKAGDRKLVCFTFDDGCRDNLAHALPIFREFRVPFAVNITNGFVGGTVPVWWYFLEDALTANWRLTFRWQGQPYDLLTDTPEARDVAYDVLAGLFRSLGSNRDDLVQCLAEATEVDPLASTRRLSMTWDEVRQMAADPLVTIGAHTHAHHSLNQLSDAELLVEVRDARVELEAQIGRPVRHFAYPFGGSNAVNEREFALVRSLGFSTMVTTRAGYLSRHHAGLLDRLPRVGISGNASVPRSLQLIERGLAALWPSRSQS